MQEVTATEFARRLSAILDAVEHRGERFVVRRGGTAVAVVGPVAPATGKAVKEFLSAHRADRGWASDLAALRRALGAQERSWPG